MVSELKLIVNELSEEEQIKLLRYDPYSIEYFQNPSVTIQQLAIKIHPVVIERIKNPSLSLIELALSLNPNISIHISHLPIDQQNFLKLKYQM
jgi:hypothetical protein